MVAPTFEPGAQAGQTSLVAQQQETANQSWMDRAQLRQQRQMEIEQQVRELPVQVLKVQADEAEQNARITKGALLQEVRRRAAVEAPKALAKFLDITAIPDLDERARALDSFSGEIAWLGNVPENKGFIDSVNDTRAKAHIDSIAMGKIAQAKEATLTRANTAEAQIEQRAKAAEEKAKSEFEKAKMIEENKNLRSQLEQKTKERGQDVASGRPGMQAAVKANESTLQVGQAAAQELRNTTQALALLDSPDLRTGTGAQFKLSAQRLGGMLGIDTGNAKDIEQLQSLFGDTLLAKAKQLKGNFSDRDREFIDRISPTVAKTTEGNRMILNVLKSHQERQVNIAKIVNDGRRDGLSEREIQLEVNDYVLNNPLGSPPAAVGGAAFDDPAKERRYQELKRAKAERDAAAANK